MRSGIRYSSFALVSVLLLCFGASSSAQIKFEDFSNTDYAMRSLWQNTYEQSGAPHLATYQGHSVLRLTDGSSNNIQASTVYFNVEQRLTSGFTTWFEFQTHNPTLCCNPGDGVAFIIQNSNGTDTTQGATGSGINAWGAGGNLAYPPQAGAMGYSGIDNSLVVEFDIHQDAWDPTPNHVAVQSCGTSYNSPVHESGTYTIGNNAKVTSCLYNQSQQSITSTIGMIGGTCEPPRFCKEGSIHDVVILYTPPPPPLPEQPGTLQIWLDPPFTDQTHHIPVPGTPTTITVPLTIEQQLKLGTTNCPPTTPQCSAWVGFTASQPAEGIAQDILGWDFSSNQIQRPIPPPGIENIFDFGPHQMNVTYPTTAPPPDGLLMTVLATPTDRNQFYQTRLQKTQFANEQCIEYQGTGGLKPDASGNCIVYSVTCQDPNTGMNVNCPSVGNQDCIANPQLCIDIDTSFFSSDNVTPTNADFLEAEPIGSNNWMSIFFSYMNNPSDGTTSGKGISFSDIVATFCPTHPVKGPGLSGCSSLRRDGQSAADWHGQAKKGAALEKVVNQK